MISKRLADQFNDKEKDSMRRFSVALLGVAAALPMIAHAAPPPADPADPAASVGAASDVPSAFADYVPYQDKGPGSWRDLNKAVVSASGMAGMNHGQMPAGGVTTSTKEHSTERGGVSR
ncbi:hypothetical protein [Paraburkholderia aromaticivorans]|uniref:hypothetical protein n=1 Tax=Paraburkholderia aromaticivorans TaxID=2026199 RepID=UPI0038B7C74B